MMFFEEFTNPTPPISELLLDNSLIAKKAGESDIAIISIGRNAGEGRDRKLENDKTPPQEQPPRPAAEPPLQ